MSYYILKFYDENNNLVHTSLEDDVFDVKLDGQKITGVDFFQIEGRSSNITVDADSTKWYLYNLYTNPQKMEGSEDKNIIINSPNEYLKYKVQVIYNETILFTGWIKYSSIKYNKKDDELEFVIYDSSSMFVYALKLIDNSGDTIVGGNGVPFTVYMDFLLANVISGYLNLNVNKLIYPYNYETGYVYENEKVENTDYSELGDGITSWLSLYDFGDYISFNNARYTYEISTEKNDNTGYHRYIISYRNEVTTKTINGINITNSEIIYSDNDIVSSSYIYTNNFLARLAAEAIALDFINITKLYKVNKKELTTANGIYSVFDYLRFSGSVILEKFYLNKDISTSSSEFIKQLLLIFNACIISRPNGDLQLASKFAFDTNLGEITIDEDDLFSYNAEYILRSVPDYSQLNETFNYSNDFFISLQKYYRNKFNEIQENLSVELDLDGTEYNIFQKLIIFGREWQINSIKKDYKNETIKIDCWG